MLATSWAHGGFGPDSTVTLLDKNGTTQSATETRQALNGDTSKLNPSWKSTAGTITRWLRPRPRTRPVEHSMSE
ncbi:MAG: hypothetical protein J07HX5_00482 [halophilic archaeon J07HX5]|nr:MAG: hypothetical protein J07HX5_00482 [halophilic archaeon J07HX5]